MANLFRNLELQAFKAGINPRTRESRDWFRKRASRMRRLNRKAILKDEELIKTPKHVVGSMQMFFYDPKHKATLPYFDTFPLSIIMGPAEGGFMGLNLHYLPPVLRAKFLDGLLDLADSKTYDDDTKFIDEKDQELESAVNKDSHPTQRSKSIRLWKCLTVALG